MDALYTDTFDWDLALGDSTLCRPVSHSYDAAPCKRCRFWNRLCRKCKLKLLFTQRRENEIGEARISNLERISPPSCWTAETQSKPLCFGNLTEIRVSLPKQPDEVAACFSSDGGLEQHDIQDYDDVDMGNSEEDVLEDPYAPDPEEGQA